MPGSSIEWVPQTNFANNSYILTVAQAQYVNGGGMLVDSGFPHTYFTDEWKQMGSGRNY